MRDSFTSPIFIQYQRTISNHLWNSPRYNGSASSARIFARIEFHTRATPKSVSAVITDHWPRTEVLQLNDFSGEENARPD
jgi:hypothetical protein